MNRPRHTFPRRKEIDLMLAILAASVDPGARLTQREIAAFCGCSRQAVAHMEKKAVSKLRAEAVKRGVNLQEELSALTMR